MNQNKLIIRKAMLELYALDHTEVVKTAGILRQLKNWFKKITNPEYKERVQSFQENTTELQNLAKELGQLLSELQSSLNSGDLDQYTEVFKNIKALTGKIYNELNALGEEGKGVKNILWYYTKEDMLSPGFKEKFKDTLPKEYDLQLDEVYNMPLKEFLWYKNISSDQIYIRKGEGVSALSQLVERVKKRLISDKMLDEEEIQSLFNGSNLDNFLLSFQEAILNGTLIKVEAKKPSGQINQIQGGQTVIYAKTAPFSIPNLTPSISIQAEVQLIDKRTALTSMDKLSLQATKNVTILPGKISSYIREIIEKTAAESQLIPYQSTPLSEVELAKALREGYRIAFGNDPTAESLAGGWAQVSLENGGGKYIYNNNFGNIKATTDWIKSGKPYAIKTTGEYTKDGKYYEQKDAPWRVYNTPAEGAAGYWKLIGNRYGNALDWMASGDPESASVSLALNHYYTASVKKYSGAMSSLYSKFMEKIAPQLSGLKSAPTSSPGEKPMIKQWISEYSNNEKNSILNKMGPSSDEREVDQIIQALSSEQPLTKMVKKSMLKESLPENRFVIYVKSIQEPQFIKIEYARVLSNILRKFADASVVIHGDSEGELEIECKTLGPIEEAFSAIRALCDCVSEGLLSKSGSYVRSTVFVKQASQYPVLDLDVLLKNHRMFVLDKIVGKLND